MEHERGFLLLCVWKAANPMAQLNEFCLDCYDKPLLMPAADSRRSTARRDGQGWALQLEIDDTNLHTYSEMCQVRVRQNAGQLDGHDVLTTYQKIVVIITEDGANVQFEETIIAHYYPTFRPHRDGVCFSWCAGYECILELQLSADDLAAFHELLVRRNLVNEAI